MWDAAHGARSACSVVSRFRSRSRSRSRGSGGPGGSGVVVEVVEMDVK